MFLLKSLWGWLFWHCGEIEEQRGAAVVRSQRTGPKGITPAGGA